MLWIAVMHHPFVSRCVTMFVLAASLSACTDPELPGGDPEAAQVATQSQALHTVKASITAVLITEFAVPLGCRGLEGSAFIPDATGNTHGTTIANSDCHWNTASQACECTITFTQRL